MSRKIRVRLAELGAFPIHDRAQILQVRRGDPLKISCQPPTGVPDPEIYWTDNTNTGDQFGFRVDNPRIQQDYDGWCFSIYLIMNICVFFFSSRKSLLFECKR